MIGADHIRDLSIQGRNDEIKSLLLSEKSRKVYRFVFDGGEVTASEVAKKFCISTQHASGILSKLWKQMYLRRYHRPQSSGGYEWVYYRE